MAILNITLPEGANICNGKQVTFRAPCDSIGVTALKISATTYTLLDSAGKEIDKGVSFATGSLISVLIDTEQNKAFLQGSPKGANIVQLTYAEYQALEVKSPDTIYLITDQDPVYVSNDQLGVSVATLVDGKVPTAQLPDMDYIPNSAKGIASGVATLDADGKVPADQLPTMDYAPSYTYGTEDLTAGTSPLETGRLYFVYE